MKWVGVFFVALTVGSLFSPSTVTAHPFTVDQSNVVDVRPGQAVPQAALGRGAVHQAERHQRRFDEVGLAPGPRRPSACASRGPRAA